MHTKPISTKVIASHKATLTSGFAYKFGSKAHDLQLQICSSAPKSLKDILIKYFKMVNPNIQKRYSSSQVESNGIDKMDNESSLLGASLEPFLKKVSKLLDFPAELLPQVPSLVEKEPNSFQEAYHQIEFFSITKPSAAECRLLHSLLPVLFIISKCEDIVARYDLDMILKKTAGLEKWHQTQRIAEYSEEYQRRNMTEAEKQGLVSDLSAAMLFYDNLSRNQSGRNAKQRNLMIMQSISDALASDALASEFSDALEFLSNDDLKETDIYKFLDNFHMLDKHFRHQYEIEDQEYAQHANDLSLTGVTSKSQRNGTPRVALSPDFERFRRSGW